MRALQRYGCRIRVLCPDTQLAFWAASGFKEGIAYPVKASAREISRHLGEVEAVLLWEANAAADACVKSKVAKRYGPAGNDLGKRLTDPLSILFKPGPIRHRVQFYLEIADALGAEAFVAENFQPVKTEIKRGMAVLLAPDSDRGRHYEWPLERWVELTRNLKDRGAELEIATLGSLGHALAAQFPDILAVTFEYPALDELSKYFACILADGSLPHLSAHVGTINLVLFGPGEPEWLRPLGKQHVYVRRKVECSPCFANRCVMDLRCQNDLTVEEVLRGIDSLAPD
jgi:ADP-heptose:LPS heptosyltransferase